MSAVSRMKGRGATGKPQQRRSRVTGVGRAILLACIALAMASCGEPETEVPIVTAERDIDIDVRSSLFNAADPESPDTQGLGATALTLSVVTDPGGASEATLLPADLDLTAEANGYTRVSFTVEGTLVSVSATVDTAAGSLSETLDDYPGSEVYQGWTDFRNVRKFRLTYSVAGSVEGSALSLSVAPKGGGAVTVRADSGVAGTDYNTGLTDRSATLESAQVAVHVNLGESRNGVVLDVYTAVIDADIDALYNGDVNFDGTYASDPWTPAWTYAEIAADGRSVGGTLYRLEPDPFLTEVDAADPAGDGMFSLLVDLQANTDPDLLNKYLLVGITVTVAGLSVPLDVLCLDIQ